MDMALESRDWCSNGACVDTILWNCDLSRREETKLRRPVSVLIGYGNMPSHYLDLVRSNYIILCEFTLGRGVQVLNLQ